MFNDAVSRLAHEFYVVSGYAEGRELENWLRAENYTREILVKFKLLAMDTSVSHESGNHGEKKALQKVSAVKTSQKSEAGISKKPVRQSPKKSRSERESLN
ncbi:MAG: DUF2934 domain-containing protein [Nitrospiraceae bacterium]|nr:DUF2934 domain-containing protein [Nitrospiraceae bacterium]